MASSRKAAIDIYDAAAAQRRSMNRNNSSYLQLFNANINTQYIVIVSLL